ncbi:hypothetical protein V2A60_008063 [Cordyceps javanica]|uniref:D-isomer specific 2-hydroxyacid dehydrogenase, NAD-binding protein n=1 Tax=Cordyceps javanica TaxID=43265 RepID=A0A545UNS7_9HYPO|nr:D-isomer specific 2-hydroxyacid dehydrogenase, NAD-binding protein [Cordyceps javanica]TQW02880.1 D-isomer specific 2-hydroxyacid dehydrogenase, NAD-binding protein [Cordyceps javanica]
MRLAVFSTKPYDKKYIALQNNARAGSSSGIDIAYHDFPLSTDTAALAEGADAVCVFVNDGLGSEVIKVLARIGISAILLRCAGFNNVDLEAAKESGIMVANVPSYSPESVAEFTVALIQTLNRNTHRAYNRLREGNFALDGLLGFTLHGKTVGIVGTGKIGIATAKILNGFRCRILAYDKYESPALAGLGEYMALDEMLPECDIISLHCPLTEETRHLIDESTIARMKRGVMIVNTARGGLLDTAAAIKALKAKQIGSLALDVYEDESALFYNDHSGDVIHDDLLMRLMTFPNVIVCGHQAFFTDEALSEIASVTLQNLEEFIATGTCKNSLTEALSSTSRPAAPARGI